MTGESPQRSVSRAAAAAAAAIGLLRCRRGLCVLAARLAAPILVVAIPAIAPLDVAFLER